MIQGEMGRYWEVLNHIRLVLNRNQYFKQLPRVYFNCTPCDLMWILNFLKSQPEEAFTNCILLD
jgi:hypothetical protein